MRLHELCLMSALVVGGCAISQDLPEPTLTGNAPAEDPLSDGLKASTDEKPDLYQVAYHKYWAGQEREAFELMIALAERGDPRAEFWIGSRYLGGRVFENNDAKAVRWIRRSAEHGYALAQFNLGIMHRDGRRGVPQNLNEAQKWFRLAAAQGDSSARAALVELEDRLQN